LANLTEAKQTAFKWIDDNAERISDFHSRIWNYAESSFREYRSAKALVEFHREEGFKVEHGVAGITGQQRRLWSSTGRRVSR